MCGIIYAKRRDNRPVAKGVLKRYQKQRGRGSEGFGFITIDKGKISDIQRFEKEADALAALRESNSSQILFHHRFPTSTPNYRDLTHPIVVKNKILDKDYYVVHNGVLGNEDTLKATHEAMGFQYTTIVRETTIIETTASRTEKVVEKFNDSESLAIEVALFLDGKKQTIDAVGTIAFICVETDKQGNALKIHYGRNSGNPLVVEDNRDLFFLKSTGEGVPVKEDEILTIDCKSGEVETQLAKVGRRYEQYNRTTWPDDDMDADYAASVMRHHRGEAMEREESGLAIIGFGARDRDVPLLSPKEFIPEKFIKDHPQNQSELPFGMSSVDEEWEEMANMEDMDFEGGYLNDEHLLDLWEEIEALEIDIKECQAKIRSMDVMSDEAFIYHREYLEECVENLQVRKEEASKLEKYLEIKRRRQSRQ